MSRTKPKVLLLEDAEDIRILLSRLLVSYGCEPALASTAEESYAYLESGTIDLALLDVMLPGLDGRNVAAEFQRLNATFPVYFMTGVPSALSDEDLANVSGVLVKPFTIDDLRQLLDQTVHCNCNQPEESKAPSKEQRALEALTAFATEKEALERQEQQFQKFATRLQGESLSSTIEDMSKQRNRSLDHLQTIMQDVQNLLKAD